MKRTNKHTQETAKPPQPVFKPVAQELEEFKAKVLDKYGEDGPDIWRALDVHMDYLFTWPEIRSIANQLRPEFERILTCDHAAWNRYVKRRNALPKIEFFPKLRGLPGTQRKNAERDALIYRLYKQGTEKTDQQVANMLEHKYGTKMSRQAVRRAYDREEERRRRQAAKLNSC